MRRTAEAVLAAFVLCGLSVLAMGRPRAGALAEPAAARATPPAGLPTVPYRMPMPPRARQAG